MEDEALVPVESQGGLAVGGAGPDWGNLVQLILRHDMTERWYEILIAWNCGADRYLNRRRSCGWLRMRYVL